MSRRFWVYIREELKGEACVCLFVDVWPAYYHGPIWTHNTSINTWLTSLESTAFCYFFSFLILPRIITSSRKNSPESCRVLLYSIGDKKNKSRDRKPIVILVLIFEPAIPMADCWRKRANYYERHLAALNVQGDVPNEKWQQPQSNRHYKEASL